MGLSPFQSDQFLQRGRRVREAIRGWAKKQPDNPPHARHPPACETGAEGEAEMKSPPRRLIYTIVAGDKPIVALEASGREAGELCKEDWFQAELSGLKSKGEALYGPGIKLRARPAVEEQLVKYEEASKHAQGTDEILFVYLVELDCK
jgi:hypothetical protein